MRKTYGNGRAITVQMKCKLQKRHGKRAQIGDLILVKKVENVKRMEKQVEISMQTIYI